MLGGEAMGVGGMSAMLKESMESMESEGVVVESSAAESGASGAPAPGPDSEPPDPAYTPDVIELGLRKLPAGLGGRGGENVVFKWPTGERFDGWAVDGVMAGRGTCAFEGGTRVIQLLLEVACARSDAREERIHALSSKLPHVPPLCWPGTSSRAARFWSATSRTT